MSSVRWTKHLKDKESKVAFELRLAHSKDILSVLKNIIEEDLSNVDKAMLKVEAYEKGAWSYFQADQLGSKRSLIKLLELLP